MVLNFKDFKTSVNQLKTPTVLEKAVDTPDDQGGQVRTWVPQTGTIWCYDVVRRAVYVGEGGQEIVEVLHIVTMRYNPAVESGAKWRFNGPYGVWYIKEIVDPLNDKHWHVGVSTEVEP